MKRISRRQAAALVEPLRRPIVDALRTGGDVATWRGTPITQVHETLVPYTTMLIVFARTLEDMGLTPDLPRTRSIARALEIMRPITQAEAEAALRELKRIEDQITGSDWDRAIRVTTAIAAQESAQAAREARA